MASSNVTIGQSGPSLVVPQISSAPAQIGAPQYVANATDRAGKQGGTFLRPQYAMPQFGNPYSANAYNQAFGLQQQPMAQGYLPFNHPPTSSGVPQPNGNAQIMPAISQLQSSMPVLPEFTPPPQPPVAQPPAQPQAPVAGPGNLLPGYSVASYDRGNGRMPYRTLAR